MVDSLNLLNKSICSTKVCGLVIQQHGTNVLNFYKHEFINSLAIRAMDVIVQNLHFLFLDPSFVLKLITDSTVFVVWSKYIEIKTGTEFKEKEILIFKIGKCLLFLAHDPKCHLQIIDTFMQKFINLIGICDDIIEQRDVLQFVNDLLIINPIPFTYGNIASYLQQIMTIGRPDKPKLATLALWCFSLFFDINYSKAYEEFFQNSGIFMHIADMVSHNYIQVIINIR